MKKQKIIKILFVMLLLPKLASAVYINQVLYDPSGSESTSEAIELYNSAQYDVDISGWVIATETSSTDAVIPASTIIPAQGYYLVADSGWNTSRDSAWREADYEETITMNNDDSGIALKDSNGSVVDAVGWGNASGIKNNMFEGTPAADTREGKALLRQQDTGDNFDDFIAADPDFSDPNAIRITVNVTSTNTSDSPVSGITLPDDDSGKEGIQVKPVSGSIKKVRIVAVASGGVTATFLGQTIQFSNLGNDTYEGILELDSSLASGNYTILINGEEFDFEYLPLLDFRVQAGKLAINAVPGRDAFSKEPVIIRNTGNVDFTLTLESNGLKNGNQSISADNLKISNNNEDFYGLGEGFALGPGDELELYFMLSVPQGTKQGSYSSTIILSAEED